jgi:hypothetical protein
MTGTERPSLVITWTTGPSVKLTRPNAADSMLGWWMGLPQRLSCRHCGNPSRHERLAVQAMQL